MKNAWLGVAVALLAGTATAQDTARTGTSPPTAAAGKLDEPGLAALLENRRDPQGRRCELRAIARSDNLRYLACGEAGVWVVRLVPGRMAEVVEQRPTPGTASGFFMRDSVLWVETTTIQAERLAPVGAATTIQGDLLREPVKSEAAPEQPRIEAPSPNPGVVAPSPAPSASDVPRAAAPIAQGPPKATERAALVYDEFEPEPARVVAVEPGFAVIDMGSSHGVLADDHVAFERISTERIHQDHVAKRRDRVAVGNAQTVGPQRTRVALGVGERVDIGMTARPTRDPLSASTFAPPRLAGVFHAGFMAKPFLVVDNLGVGAVLEARAGYRFDFPFHLEVLLRPLMVATGRDGGLGAAAGIVTATFDSRLFEVGLGIGGQTVNDPAFDLEPGSGTTIAQRVRVGSVDGGMIEVMTYIVLFHSEFEFSDIRIEGQLPIGNRSWLLLNAGGGSLGVGFADIGLRVLLDGNGDRGSLFVSASIGGVHVFKSEFDGRMQFNATEREYLGPMAGIGAEWRW